MKSPYSWRDVLRACAALVLYSVASGAYPALSYPTRPIRLVVPFPAGGGADTMARIIAPKLTSALGEQWVVDNRGGAGGNLAAEIVVHAAPDGYTAFMGFSTVLTVNPSLYKLSFNVEKDLQPITTLANAQYILVVNPKVQATTLKEFIALAKDKPGVLNFSSGGVGTPLHLAAELFQKRAGIRMVHLPYKGGGPAAAAVLSGEAQVLFGSVAATMQQVKGGRLRALATTGLKRSIVAPNLPTIAEAGVPGYEALQWYGLLAPRGTPNDIVMRLHNEAVTVLRNPVTIERLARDGGEVIASSPEAFRVYLRAETEKWATVVKNAGIKPE